MQEGPRALVVGGGVGGLASAVMLAARGFEVTLLERASSVGGKVRQTTIAGRGIDAGPTVMTMRWALDAVFESAGAKLDERVTLHRADLLARHAWPDGSRLDLFADLDKTADAIGRFAGRREADGYRRFAAYAQRIYATVERPFLSAQRPTLTSMLGSAYAMGLSSLLRIDGHRTLARALGDFFQDPRLLQLFSRYATYVGSSPFLAPATLSVIAHVERDGLWLVEGGMRALVDALAQLLLELGGTIRTDAHVASIDGARGRATGVTLASGEELGADAIVWNGDAGALAQGLAGEAASRATPRPGGRSLSAVTWAVLGVPKGFPLVRHNVFFSSDYRAEFSSLFDRDALAREATVYVCAQDRDDAGVASSSVERFLLLVNAPATGSSSPLSPAEVSECEQRCFDLLRRSGLELEPRAPSVVTTPTDFARMFPATEGALYGTPSHGWKTMFERASARTSMKGLYLAGGSAHPGAGVPMAAISGRLAVEAVISDLTSTRSSLRTATLGGISTR